MIDQTAVTKDRPGRTHTDGTLSDPNVRNKKLIEAILPTLGDSDSERFGVIADYKGMRRQRLAVLQSMVLLRHTCQIQTYAHLGATGRQPIRCRVVILYCHSAQDPNADRTKNS